MHDLVINVLEVVVLFGGEFDGAVSVQLLHNSSIEFVEFGPAAVGELLEVLSYIFDCNFALLVSFHESAQLLNDLAGDVFSLLNEDRLEDCFEVLQCLVTRVLSDRVLFVGAT